jgi:5-methyltetrahydropteroyltriglutamate--homocysteine methyltransferase
MTTPFPTATITGYPRIGARREQKKALEAYWAGRIDAADFTRSVHTLRIDTYHRLAQLGLSEDYAIPATYSHYDHVLDTALAVGLIPSAPVTAPTRTLPAASSTTSPLLAEPRSALRWR